MMWKRRVGVMVLIVLLLFQGTSGSASPPSHRLFSSSEQDLLSIVSYLSDVQTLCEEAMRYCFSSNVTINFDDPITSMYDEDYATLSNQTKEQLKTTFLSTIFNTSDIYEQSESYELLGDVLRPLHNLVENVSLLVNNHCALISIFIELIALSSNDTINRQQINQEIHSGYLILSECKQGLLEIDAILLDLPAYVSTKLDTYTSLLNTVFHRYQTYLEMFLKRVSSVEPELFLFIEDNQYYIGENILITGVFISNSSSIKEQQISIYLDETLMIECITDENGSFQTNIMIPDQLEPKIYSLHAETVYQDTLVSSSCINITISLLPTFLSLYLSQKEYSPGEDIHITGRLYSYNKKGIKDGITIQLAQHSFNVLANETGHYQCSTAGIQTCGIYTIQSIFEPESIYAPCSSDKSNFSINYPTKLTIAADRPNASIGDIITISGRLSNSSSNRSLNNKIIFLSLNNKNISKSLTNETGWYRFLWDTSNESDGIYESSVTFYSDDLSLRNGHSNSLKMQLSTSFFASLLHLFTLALQQLLIPFCLIATLIILLYLFKRSTKRKKGKASELAKIQEMHNTDSLRQPFDEILKERYKTATSLNKKIIYQYHLLIHQLMSKGLSVTKANTHLEVQNILLKKGYPSDSVNSVTITFEQVQYASYIADDQDLIRFNDTIISIINHGGQTL